MKCNIHILAEMVAQKDKACVGIHEVEVTDESDDIKITYDVIVPQKEITFTKKQYRKYLRSGKLDDLGI